MVSAVLDRGMKQLDSNQIVYIGPLMPARALLMIDEFSIVHVPVFVVKIVLSYFNKIALS